MGAGNDAATGGFVGLAAVGALFRCVCAFKPDGTGRWRGSDVGGKTWSAYRFFGREVNTSTDGEIRGRD